MTKRMKLSGINVKIVKKDIKNVHLSVHPPTGKVTISAPRWLGENAIRVFAISKLRWIKKQQAKFQFQERESQRELLDRESHYLWGERHLLKVVDTYISPSVERKHRSLLLNVPSKLPRIKREAVLEKWYRKELKEAIPPLIYKWEPIIGAQVRAWGVKKMKTKWGSCNTAANRIWLNLELVKKPAECLEYVVVHEMIHLLERKHNQRFIEHLDKLLPHWRTLRHLLNSFPLRHESWTY